MSDLTISLTLLFHRTRSKRIRLNKTDHLHLLCSRSVKGCTGTEAFCIGHDAAIIICKETGFHVVLKDAATADTTGSAGTGGSLGKPGNIRAVLGAGALDSKGFLGAQGGLADPILEGAHEADYHGVQDQGDHEPGDRHFCSCSQNAKGSRTHKG